MSSAAEVQVFKFLTIKCFYHEDLRKMLSLSCSLRCQCHSEGPQDGFTTEHFCVAFSAAV